MSARTLTVIDGGLQTTVQDYPGRLGLRAKGFFPAGPMDHFAHRAANLLVGNPESAATLEVTLGNVAFRFDVGATVAVTGAAAELTIDGDVLSSWESRWIAAGSVLRIGIAPGPGFRLTVAVTGGIDVPLLLGSRATYTMGGLGGFEGRAVKPGDVLPIGEAPTVETSGLRFRESARPTYGRDWEIEALRGPHASPDYLTEADMEVLFSRWWGIDRNSNRTGIRLESHLFEWARKTGGVAGGHPSNILDNGYSVGAVNVNGDLPVILGLDGPTAGGFICAATLAHAGLWKIGQLRPVGDRLRFREVTLEEAACLERDLDSLLTRDSLEEV